MISCQVRAINMVNNNLGLVVFYEKKHKSDYY
jgi:hypothetical protein